MTIHALDLIFVPDMKNPEVIDLVVLTKTDTPEERSDLMPLVNVRLAGEDLTPTSFSNPEDYLKDARKAVVDCIMHFTGQEEEILPFSAPDTAREIFNALLTA